ncbi:MAG: hypothetical protein JNL82_10190 [Myxococcales bacterium]|nr:hypothetical protein [Myxococcales bacterium]
MTLRLSVVLALALTPGLASAAPAKAAAPAKTDVDADAAARKTNGKTTVYDFENDHVPGELMSPEGANINSRVGTRHKSLITIRPHFVPQMIQMANDV